MTEDRRHNDPRRDDDTKCLELLAIEKDILNATSAIEKLEKRLFEDNGTLSIQSRLNKIENSLASMLRVIWTVATAVIGLIVAAIWKYILG